MPRDGREPNCSLILRNLADGARSDELREIFGEFGRLKDVYIPLDYHTRRQRGFAYVQFEDPRDAEDALKELDGTKYMDSEMRIDIARGDRKTPSEMKYKDRGGRYRDDRRDYGDRRGRRHDDDDDYEFRRRDRTRSRSRNRRRRSRSRSDSRVMRRRRVSPRSPKRERSCSNSRRSVSPVKTKSSQVGSNENSSRHREESSPRGKEQGQSSQRRVSRSYNSRSRSRS